MNTRIALLLVASIALVPALSEAQAADQAIEDGVAVGADYVIGPDDVLAVNFWRDPDMSAEVVVRPDGKISLPLLNEIVAAGETPAQLQATIVEEARRFLENPNATVVVREVNSRKVYITGAVAEPGSYPLTTPTTVLQLLAMAGGITDWAKRDRIVVVRTIEGTQVGYRFNYDDVGRNRNLGQNILLEPGDTVLVPQ